MYIYKPIYVFQASGAQTRQAPLFKRRQKRFSSHATQNTRESSNLKNAATWESMEVSQLMFVLHAAQHHYSTSRITVQCLYTTTVHHTSQYNACTPPQYITHHSTVRVHHYSTSHITVQCVYTTTVWWCGVVWCL